MNELQLSRKIRIRRPLGHPTRYWIQRSVRRPNGKAQEGDSAAERVETWDSLTSRVEELTAQGYALIRVEVCMHKEDLS